MLIVVISKLVHNKALIPYLYFAYVIVYVSSWYYAQTHILTVLDLSVERMSDDKLNANTLAYYTFYYTIATFICVDLINKPKVKKVFQLLFLLSIPM